LATSVSKGFETKWSHQLGGWPLRISIKKVGNGSVAWTLWSCNFVRNFRIKIRKTSRLRWQPCWDIAINIGDEKNYHWFTTLIDGVLLDVNWDHH
jgi:hypothetical protein